MGLNISCLSFDEKDPGVEEKDGLLCMNQLLKRTPKIIHGQDFKSIYSHCQRTREIFEDLSFPPSNRSLGIPVEQLSEIEWKRASELSRNPRFFVDGASRFDINQGELGDCWLMAAMQSLAMNKPLLYKVVPRHQTFNGPGCFHFQFWQYGDWVDVVVDDYLPTKNGKLVYTHSKPSNEYWAALLEKAYAKLNGSYKALNGGFMGEAWTSFTGGVSEMFLMKNPPNDVFGIMKTAYDRQGLLGCSILGGELSKNTVQNAGLFKAHAYSITKIVEEYVATSNGYKKVRLIRIRNPWGEVEWNGRWSDGCSEWLSISQREKDRIGLRYDDDGEFYMDFEDFKNYWTNVEICNIPCVSDEGIGIRRPQLHVESFEGRWMRGKTAGGCRNFIHTFPMNPQFRVCVFGTDNHRPTMVIVSLMQKGIRTPLRDNVLKIGLELYHVGNKEANKIPLDKKFFGKNRPEKSYTNFLQFTGAKEVVGRFMLQPGIYVVVPSTFHPKETGEFFLRIFSENQIGVETFPSL